MLRGILSLCFLLTFFNSFAGVLKGTVSDQKDGSPLVGVIIYYKPFDTVTGSKGGVVTDIDGKYEIVLKEGKYTLTFSYVTYTTESRLLTIGRNTDSVMNMKLLAEIKELNATEIKAKRITNTETAVISEIKAANAVVSGTGSTQISKSMDRNAADVVKRIPGVSIQDDRFVVIRGLPDRYNAVWLNDAGAPSSEADKKSFSFDIIPSGLIDRVLIYKTPSPELPGDFAGGMVKVYTTSIADKNQLMVNLQTSSRAGTTGESFSHNKASNTDWLGFDDGGRNLPTVAPVRVDKSDATQDHVAISKAFKNDWIVQQKTASPDMRLAMSYTSVLNKKKFRMGNTFGLSYSNTSTIVNANRQDWDSSESRNYDYNDHIFTNSVSVGLVENVGLSIGNSKFEFKNLYSQIGKSSVVIRNSGADSALTPELSYAMGYDSKATYSTQLGGSHRNDSGTRKYNWTIGYNDVFKNQPNLRRIKYTKAGNDTTFKAAIASSVDANFGGGRYYAELFEKMYSFNHSFSQVVKVGKDYKFSVNVGNYLESKNRALNIRKFSYTIDPTRGNGPHADSLKKLGINEIFADTNVGTKKNFVFDEGTDSYDKYSAKNMLIASYVSINAPIGNRINVVGGVRQEHNEQSIVGYTSTDTLTPKVTTNFLLPSINISYNFNKRSLVRAAYGKTLNRPEFREFAPIVYYDFEELALTKGSLYPTNSSPKGDTLKVATVHNFDVRYEFYPSSGEILHVGAFYKSINNAIQRVIDFGTSGDNKTLTFVNGSTAYCMGLELDVRKNLVFLDNKLGTKFFKDLSFVGNLALSKSESRIDTTIKHYQIPVATLQGQSPYLINVGTYYQNDKTGLKGSLLYNVFGARLYATGTIENSGESIGELPFQSLDMTISKLFKKHYLLNFGIQNLLDSKVSFVKDINRNDKFDSNTSDRQYRIYAPGRYYTIGLKLNF